MRVAFTPAQAKALYELAKTALGPAAPYLVQPVAVGPRKVAYWMPVIGWVQLLNAVIDNTLGPLGGDDRSAGGMPLIRARTTLAREVNRVTNHPAMYARGLPGQKVEQFIVWPSRGGTDRFYSPVPPEHALSVEGYLILIPDWEWTKAGVVTEWHARKAVSHAAALTAEFL